MFDISSWETGFTLQDLHMTKSHKAYVYMYIYNHVHKET